MKQVTRIVAGLAALASMLGASPAAAQARRCSTPVAIAIPSSQAVVAPACM